MAARFVQPFMTEAASVEMSAAGGLMLMGIGISLPGVMKICAVNMLPGLAAAIIFARFLL